MIGSAELMRKLPTIGERSDDRVVEVDRVPECNRLFFVRGPSGTLICDSVWVMCSIN